MEPIKKKMQSIKIEKDNAVDRAEAAEAQLRDANLRVEKVNLCLNFGVDRGPFWIKISTHREGRLTYFIFFKKSPGNVCSNSAFLARNFLIEVPNRNS